MVKHTMRMLHELETVGVIMVRNTAFSNTLHADQTPHKSETVSVIPERETTLIVTHYVQTKHLIN